MNQKTSYDTRLLMPVLLIATLSASDAKLTLLILERGGSELNPVMAWVMTYGDLAFFVIKYLMTAAGLFMLVMYTQHNLFQRVSVMTILISLTVFYVALVGYECGLLIASVECI